MEFYVKINFNTSIELVDNLSNLKIVVYVIPLTNKLMLILFLNFNFNKFKS